MNIQELTAELHQRLGEELLTQIKAGKVSSGVLAAAIKWLKDQNMVINMAQEGLSDQNIGPSLVEDLPFHNEIFKNAQ